MKIVAGEGQKKREILGPQTQPSGHHPSGPLRGTLPSAHFRSFSLSGGLLVEFWWCLKHCTSGLSGCRVEPRRLLQNVKNNFTIDLPPPPLRPPKKSIINCYNFCWHPEKKASPKFHGKTPTHLRDPHLLALTFSGLLFLLLVQLLLFFSTFAALLGRRPSIHHLCNV